MPVLPPVANKQNAYNPWRTNILRTNSISKLECSPPSPRPRLNNWPPHFNRVHMALRLSLASSQDRLLILFREERKPEGQS